MQYTAFLILSPISIIVLLAVFSATRRYRGAPDVAALRWLMATVTGWLLFNTLEVLAPDPSRTLFWGKVTYVFIAATPMSWLVFAMQHTSGVTRAWLRTTAFWLFLIIPTVTVILIWTNELHYLVWTAVAFVPVEGFLALQVEYGIAFWVFIIHGYALVMLGALFVVRHHLVGRPLYRFQSRWLLIGALVPVTMNFVYVFRLLPGMRKDYTPIGFAAAGMAFSIGILWHRLFDLKPIARAALIDRLVDPVLTTDLEGRLVDFNPAAGELLTILNGDKDPDALIGVSLSEALQGWPALVAYLRGEALHSADLTLNSQGGTRVYECSAPPLESVRDRQIGRLVILHEITERKETERVLRYHMAELEASNDHLDAFAHTVAHDLKAPLTSIIGYGEMLSFYFDQLTREQVQEHLHDLVQTGERMVKIIDALLLFSRIHRQSKLALDCINVGDLVAESLDRVGTPLMQREARLSNPASWPTVLCHGPWVVEVWVNYLTNALKYGGSPPVIELGYDPEPAGVSDGRFLRFWVRDHGAGLTASQIEKLFVPFSRLHSSEAQGHGLGLSIVRRIVERLGGQVGVESVPGEGSTFWFTLPAAETPPGTDGNLNLIDIQQQGAVNAVGEADFAGL
jgi:signal transduction histidine kinase